MHYWQVNAVKNEEWGAVTKPGIERCQTTLVFQVYAKNVEEAIKEVLSYGQGKEVKIGDITSIQTV
jgi:hypothetical protein